MYIYRCIYIYIYIYTYIHTFMHIYTHTHRSLRNKLEAANTDAQDKHNRTGNLQQRTYRPHASVSHSHLPTNHAHSPTSHTPSPPTTSIPPHHSSTRSTLGEQGVTGHDNPCERRHEQSHDALPDIASSVLFEVRDADFLSSVKIYVYV